MGRIEFSIYPVGRKYFKFELFFPLYEPGIVRGIDSFKGLVYVITPVPQSVLEKVDLLLQGFIQIPTCLLQVINALLQQISLLISGNPFILIYVYICHSLFFFDFFCLRRYDKTFVAESAEEFLIAFFSM